MKQLKEKLKRSKKLKILIIRLKPVGDTILISAVFRNLKRLFPNCNIDIVVYPSAKDAIGANPYINNIIILKRTNLSKLLFYLKLIFTSHYDITIDYINNPTSTFITLFSAAKIKIGKNIARNFFYTHKLNIDENIYSAIKSLYLLKPLGLKNFNDYMPEFFIKENDLKKAKNILKKAGITSKDKIIGIFVSAKYPTRKYIPEGFAELAKKIINKFDCKVLLLFGKNDIETYRSIKKDLGKNRDIIYISDKITIGEMAAIISRLRYFITNDTGPKHLATALNIPTLTIFGATDETTWNPPDFKRFATIRKKLPCAPCNKLSCDSLECMKNLSPDEIFKKIKPLLRRFLKNARANRDLNRSSSF